MIPDGDADATDAGNEHSTDERPKDAPCSAQQAVRFASGVEEIEPVKKVHDMTKTDKEGSRSMEDLTPEAKEEIRNLAMTLQKSRLQESRMSNFQFEPVSLPASRVSPSTATASLGRDTSGFVLCVPDFGCNAAVLSPYGCSILGSLEVGITLADARRQSGPLSRG